MKTLMLSQRWLPRKLVTMETATPVLVMLIFLTMVGLTKQYQYEEYAQECRVYQLKGHTKRYESPTIPVRSIVTLSFYNEEANDFLKDIHILLKEKTLNGTNKLKIHVNPDGVLFLDHAKFNNLTLNPSCYPRSWFTIAIMLQDQNIIIYNINNRMDYISSITALGSNATAKITTSQDNLYITANCSAGCLMHDQDSPLIGHYLPLASSVNIYLSHEEGATSATLTLGFIDHEDKRRRVTHDITTYDSSLWHKLVISHNTQEHVIIKANGGVISKVMISVENSTFAVLSSNSVLWSLHCHPDHATGLEGWGGNDNSNENVTDDKQPDKGKRGAGAAEVVAWVLAGMALFLVMIMALFICTRMGPKSEFTDYGASVGVVSYGRAMKREAEEDTEPDSPTFLSPVIQHKVPEEEDEDQSNTKML